MAELTVSQDERDRYAQFLITVGDICDAAALADLLVRVSTVDGRRVEGVPLRGRLAVNGDEVEGTGYAHGLTIGGEPVLLTDVAACEILGPGWL